MIAAFTSKRAGAAGAGVTEVHEPVSATLKYTLFFP
jgi:hypothetical protein